MRYEKSARIQPRKFYLLVLVLVSILVTFRFINKHYAQDCISSRRTQARTIPSDSFLINLTTQYQQEWKYIMTNQITAICKEPALFVMFVPISRNNVHTASQLYKTYKHHLKQLNATIIFYTDISTAYSINKNNSIRQHTLFCKFNFPDTFENLSLKIISFFNWFATCPKIQYVIKSDSDTYWDLHATAQMLEKMNKRNFKEATIIGNLQKNASVARDMNNRYFTSKEEYSESSYPLYASGGAGYILSQSAVSYVLAAAQNNPVFWMEDIYITGILPKLSKYSIQHYHIKHMYYCRFQEIQKFYVQFHQPLTQHMVSANEVQQIHQWINECTKHYVCGPYRQLLLRRAPVIL